MRRLSTYFVPALLATAGAAGAQVEWLYTNITDSSAATARAYSDAIVLWTPQGQRPVAQESHGRTATGSVRKMKCRTVAGLNYLYWYDIITDDIWRGRDVNGNGVVDPTEFQQVYNHVASSDGSLDEFAGVWWNGIGAAALGELWRFQDGNADGDFMDPGESTQVVAGTTITINTSTGPISNVSNINVTGVVAMQNGDCVWYPKGSTTAPTLALLRSTAAGAHSLYLAYGLAAGAAGRIPALPINPDFGTLLPNVGTNAVDRVAVDTVNDAVYAAVNFTAAVPQPWIFQCKDGNADGDANDAGEVKMFYDGLSGPVAFTTLDDIEWLNGRLYLSHERGQPAGPCEFIELVDLNNDGDAMDAGEQTVFGSTSTSPLDDPTVIGLTVAPAGFFGGAASSCVNVDLRNNGMVQAGGTLNLTLADIPPAQQTPLTLAFGLLGVTSDLGIPLPNGCILGLLPDSLTFATLPYLTGTPTGRSLALPGFTYPPLLAGTRIFSAALFLDLSTLSFPGVSHTAAIVVQ